MKNLIGKKVRGFKFESTEIVYSKQMDKHIGVVGEIKEYYPNTYAFRVQFPDGESWSYPAELIEQHLVEDEPTTGRKIIVNESIVSAIVDGYFSGTTIEQIRESIRQAYTAIEAGVNAQLVEIKEERGKL